jgi:hypothetical protein
MGLFKFFGSAPSEEEQKAEANDAGESQASGIVATHKAPRFDGVAVLTGAGVDEKQRERVERTLELLAALPSDASPQLRKNIVEASLKAFDVSIKAIVEAAGAEVNAYENYIAEGHKQLDELRNQSLQRISELEAEIARVQKRLEIATADQATLDEATVSAMERVRPVLGFFGEAAGRGATAVANDKKGDHPPSIIVDESLLKTG